MEKVIYFPNYLVITIFVDVLYSTFLVHNIVLQHGDKETNPKPPKTKLKNVNLSLEC